MNTFFTVDDGFTTVDVATITSANIVAEKLKKEHPLRRVFISKVVEGSNGFETEVIGEA